MMKKKDINLINLTISVLAVLISLIAAIFSYQSNRLSSNANQIAVESVKTAEKNLLFEQDKRSQDYVESVFSDLYQNKDNLASIQLLRAQKILPDNSKLDEVVDLLEGTGNSFCQGTVWKYHLNTILKKTLSDLCINDQIYDKYKSEKNGFAMLCKEFYPESKFATTLNVENLTTCNFHDSDELKRVVILKIKNGN